MNATDSAKLLLTLYELRTEPALRRARAWFAFEFNPTSAKEVLETWLAPGQESGPYRMVTTYWDMAASLVSQGAVDSRMFNAANTEHFAVFVKLRPFLAEIRSKTGYADYLASLEKVVMSFPDAENRLSIFLRFNQRQAQFAAEGRQAHFLEDVPLDNPVL
ncbi:MAG TPA: hypothetical protein VK636_15220 [Gemmatimonadaceae bacterium]|nr:hypothetical protein [Gemmatimonadaceae bacterium]